MKDGLEDLAEMTEDELFAQMDDILAEVRTDENIIKTEPPNESYHVVFSEIRKVEERRARDLLSEEDKKLLEYGARYKRQLHFRKYWILAAALVLAFAMSITSVGGPEKFFKNVIGNFSGRRHEIVDSSENIILSETLSEEMAYDTVEEEYGFRPVKPDYLPEGTVFESMEIDDILQQIKIIYTKKGDTFLQVIIYPNYRESSVGADIEDEILQEYTVLKDDIEIAIREYRVTSGEETRWTASFLKGSTLYLILTLNTDQTEFEGIVHNLNLKH